MDYAYEPSSAVARLYADLHESGVMADAAVSDLSQNSFTVSLWPRGTQAHPCMPVSAAVTIPNEDSGDAMIALVDRFDRIASIKNWGYAARRGKAPRRRVAAEASAVAQMANADPMHAG